MSIRTLLVSRERFAKVALAVTCCALMVVGSGAAADGPGDGRDAVSGAFSGEMREIRMTLPEGAVSTKIASLASARSLWPRRSKVGVI